MSGGSGRAPAIGIDLGTTYSCVGIWCAEKNSVEICTNEQGNQITPSCAAFIESDVFVGQRAKDRIKMNPKNTIFGVKRLMGTRYSDTTVKKDIGSLPFKVIEGPEDHPLISVEYKGQPHQYPPEAISCIILKNLKQAAEQFLGTTVTDAVISVPANFNDKQRQATMDAATSAGLNVMRLINEPTAAALAYELEKDKESPKESNVLIFDLGGGTFDVSLLTISNCGQINVIAVGGDTHLGGDDFDSRMMKSCIQQLKNEGKDISKNRRELGRLRAACEQAKRELSITIDATVQIYYFLDGEHFSMNFSRAKFESINLKLFKECIGHVKKCLADGNIQPKDVDEVVLIGGSTRIPKIQELLTRFFDGKALCTRINADEAVAYGAAVLAANLSGTGSKKVRDFVIQDVTSLSLGTNICGGVMDVLIPRNTPIPTIVERVYTTRFDYQTTISVQIRQSKSTRLEDILFGEFKLHGIPPALAGDQLVRVCFDVDANGILHVCRVNIQWR